MDSNLVPLECQLSVGMDSNLVRPSEQLELYLVPFEWLTQFISVAWSLANMAVRTDMTCVSIRCQMLATTYLCPRTYTVLLWVF